MNKAIKAIIAGLIPVLLMLLVPLYVGAAGLGVGPSVIEMTGLLRGEEYEGTIFAKYIGEGECVLQLSAVGDIDDWVSFYEPSDPTTPIESITTPAGEWTYILVKFKIPDDAPVGTATGTLYAATVAPEVESGQAVSLQGKVDVTITVTGMAILAGVVNNISTRDVEVGYPLHIKVGFQNTGNVVTAPQIDVKISEGNAAIDNLIFAETNVKPQSSETISVEWDTTGTEPGDYLARVAVSLGEEIISTKELNFSILPVGTLTRKGVFTELALQGEPKLGTITKVLASFFNTGRIDTKAKFIGEVYCDNELIDNLESEESLVPVGQEDTLTSYVKLERPGHYHIKGYINYEGKKTEVKEISFTLGGGTEGAGSFSLSTPAIAIIVILVGVIVYMALRRRKAA